MKVLMSCYACEPGKGSEPGVGWNWALQAARVAEVWVLTRANNRPAIEAELARHPDLNLRFVYHDLPHWIRFWKRGQRGVNAYYLLWQITAIPKVRRLHKRIGFDLGHHVTFCSIRFFSPLSLLDIPFIWGPVGGGERGPTRFYRTLGKRGIIQEIARDFSILATRVDPLVRLTARNATVVLTTTETTKNALPSSVGAKCLVAPAIGLSQSEMTELSSFDRRAPGESFRLLYVGRLVPWKGVHFAIEALAHCTANGQPVTITVVGDGPDLARLETIAHRLGVSNRVVFVGSQPRTEVLRLLKEHDAFVFPSLHDSGGFAVLEAMAAGLPVICLDLGGPALAVTADTGFRVSASTPRQVVKDIAKAIAYLRDNPDARRQLGEAARRRVERGYGWCGRSQFLRDLYTSAISDPGSNGS